MSISSEITRLQGAKSTLKTKINAKNDEQHQIDDETIDEYGDFVDSISTGTILDVVDNNVSVSGTTLIFEEISGKVTDGLLYNLETFNTFSNKYIDTQVPQTYLSSTYTIFITIRPTNWSNYRGILGLHDGSPEVGLVGFQYENGAIYYKHMGSSGINVASYIGTTNQTYDLIITFGSGKINMWCNGSKIANNVSQSNISSFNNIQIGRAFNNNDRYFAGKLGYCYIYNRVLNSDEIQQMQDYITSLKGV